LAFGGIACFIGYLGLGISAAYYLAPVDLIAVLYVGRLAILSLGAMNAWGTGALATLVLFVAVVLQDVSLSAFRVFEQKNVIHAKGEIAQVVQARYQNAAGNVRRLFFPFASPYIIMEFASYLDYRGVPVQGVIDEAGEPNSLIVVTGMMMKDGPCVAYRALICHAATTPDSGDLVIVLPDDNVSLADVTPYKSQGELSFSYESGIPQWVHPFIRNLRIISPGPLTQKELRDGWLHASVTTWK
jgi:hypothetical protein